MSNELDGIDEWIFERLAGDVAGATYTNGIPNPPAGGSIEELVGRHPVEEVVQVYCRVAPQGAVYPFIVFGYWTGHDINGTGSRRVAVVANYKIEAINQSNDFGSIGPIAKRIDQILAKNQDDDDDMIIGCRREYPIQSIEQEAGYEEVKEGGIYQIMAYSQQYESM